jgi:nickel/cobalt transporter (NicO) family protein
MELIWTIPVVMGLGALHSLEPGHGKGVITAYLISSGAHVKDAILLGLVSAIAHTLSIVFLAWVTSSAIQIFVPQNLSHLLQLLSGLIITIIGVRMIYQKIYPPIIVLGTVGHRHSETCTHHHSHYNANKTPTSLSRLFSLGFFTGMIPCPSALTILLTAISAGQVSIGLALVSSFSLGSAIAMSTIGVLVVRAGESIKQLEKWRIIDTLTFLSSTLIVCIGVFIVWQSLSNIGILLH